MLVDTEAGRTIAFDRAGSESAPAVVLLHGLSGARSTYRSVLAHLGGSVAAGSIQVVAADLRGHGASSHASRAEYDAAGYASDVITLIEHVTTVPVLLVGHSLGGVVAAQTAIERPDLVARLLLEDPPLFEGVDERRAASPVASFFPLFVAAVRELQAAGAPPHAFEELVRDATPPDAAADRAVGLSRWDPATMEAAIDGTVWTTYDPARPVPCPVTILRADPAVGAVFEPGDELPFRATNPTADIVLVPGATHGIHDAPTLPAYLTHLDAAIEAFLASS